MSRATYFVQDCPVCGRCLQVRVELLGKTVSCRHCGGSFTARDPATRAQGTPPARSEDLLIRANNLLSSVAEFRPRPK